MIQGIVFLLLFIGLGIGIFVLSVRHERRRTAKLAAVAEQLGFAFSDSEDAALVEQLAGLPLAEEGRSQSAKNVLSGQVDETEILLFEYSYVIGSGKNRHTVAQSVMCLRWPGSGLPTFTLRPEGIFHKLGELLGYKDIDFDLHPQFSKRYRLKGPDEPAVRTVFTDELLAFYQGKTGLSTEALGNVLLFYRAGKRVPPEGIAAFYEEGWTAYAAIRRLPAATGSAT